MKNLKDIITERLMIRSKSNPNIPADVIEVKFYEFVGWYVGRIVTDPDDLSKDFLAREGFVFSMSIGDDNGPDAFKDEEHMFKYYTEHKNDDIYIDVRKVSDPRIHEYDNILYIGDDIFCARSWSNFKTYVNDYLR